MPVRFQSKTEYQKSYGVSRSRSVSPRRCSPLAGLRSDQMGISREPGFQRRKRLSPGGLAQSCGSLLFPPDPRRSLAEPTPRAHRTAPPAASRSRSAHRKEPKPPTPPGARADPGSPAQPETPAGPRPAADPGPPTGPRPAADPGPRTGPRPAADPGPRTGPRPAADPGPRTGPRPAADPGPRTGPRPAADPRPSARPRTTADSGSVEPGAAGKSAKPRPSKLDSQPQPSRPLTSAPDGQQPSADEVQHALRWRAGLRSGGRRSGSQQSEYHRQFSWKKPQAAASPMLTAEQLLHSSSRSVPPFKTNPVPVETEYRRSFQGLAPPSEPRLRKHLEHQRVPLFHAYMANKKRREESEKKLHPRPDDATPPPPPQVQRGHRILEEGGAPDGEALQVKELRQKVSLYRHRGWGANFSRGHLSQLVSEHNALWEPTDTTDSTSDPPSPRLTSDLCPDPDSRSTSHVEALDLASRSSNSSRRSSAAAVVVGSGETHNVNKNKQIKAQTPQSPPAERLTAWGEEEEEEEHTDEEEGRLPTPRLKMLPVQRTHHDLTTPATGGAILVGKLKSSDDFSPSKQRSGSAVSMAAGADNVVDVPVKQKEAWPENNPARHSSSSGPSPDQKPAATPPSKPIRTKQTSPSPVAPPPLVPPPQHGIQGTLRHPDFQHNGELGLRFRELQCSGGGCGSDEDDRLSVMSWRSAASCSMASAVLERAQKRRENFWGKR
ncbi:nuclear protein MDM1 isoform X2 [Dicentrarchus labrax]|uniref:nuclear protein MDM1 isoform X2 n=1 Tax=Dicentrarchus labrax TaxID=13489 RepID=UPI0021F5529D|nr:nuclear protein MDM1 isoform X2 [Dicentrarchus labrax]